MHENSSIEGVVGTLIYRNEANGFTVMELECGDDLVIATVNAPLIGEGERIKLVGEWTVHKDYGEQFKASSCELLPPEGMEQMERFLSSGLIRGVGQSTATAIVQHFGEDTAHVMEYEAHRLSEVVGIGHKTAEKIAASYRENMHMRTVITRLTSYGITVSQAMRIANEYGDDAVQLVEENPYRLADDIFGIGFKTADAIAREMGVDHDSPFRVAAALKFYMNWAGGEGHTCVPSKLLVEQTAKGIGVDAEQVQAEAARLVVNGDFVLGSGDDEMVYLWSFHQAESESARRLADIVKDGVPPLPQDVDRCISDHERRSGIKLAEKQLEAVLAAAHGSAVVVSGGPGTGKTTIVQFIIDMFEMSGLSYALCAPTGRAAKRMGEATGVEAKTLHRLLEYGPGDNEGSLSFNRNEERPLEERAIIVDEMSMVDIFLFMRLLRALKPGTRLIMIGDSNQLPSVGAGNVLHDIIASGKIQNIELNTVYRQGEGSAISGNAHRINAGQMPQVAPGEFEVEELGNADAIWKRLSVLCADGGVQVISPMKKGGAGVLALNDKLQQLCNPKHPSKVEYPARNGLFREGDKVMQIKNNYSLEWSRDRGSDIEEGVGVFNGEMGVLEHIFASDRRMDVRYEDDRLAMYDLMQCDELERSYAITVHKSQGSEFDCVAIPVLNGPPMLYTRNLLYTAVTRAKKKVWLLGRASAVQAMIANQRTRERYSGLRDKLVAMFEGDG